MLSDFPATNEKEGFNMTKNKQQYTARHYWSIEEKRSEG